MARSTPAPRYQGLNYISATPPLPEPTPCRNLSKSVEICRNLSKPVHIRPNPSRPVEIEPPTQLCLACPSNRGSRELPPFLRCSPVRVRLPTVCLARPSNRANLSCSSPGPTRTTTRPTPRVGPTADKVPRSTIDVDLLCADRHSEPSQHCGTVERGAD